MYFKFLHSCLISKSSDWDKPWFVGVYCYLEGADTDISDWTSKIIRESSARYLDLGWASLNLRYRLVGSGQRAPLGEVKGESRKKKINPCMYLAGVCEILIQSTFLVNSPYNKLIPKSILPQIDHCLCRKNISYGCLRFAWLRDKVGFSEVIRVGLQMSWWY